MRILWVAALIPLLLATAARAIDTEPAFDDPAMQARYEKLTHEIRCLVCQNESIADSNASLAGDLRRDVRNMMADGKTDKEITKFLTDRYGDFVLYRPPFKPVTWLLWGAPGLFILVGLAMVIRTVRARARLPLEDDDSAQNGVTS